MPIGVLITRWTIRAALVCCAIAAFEVLRNRQATTRQTARLWWTAGFVLYLIHVAAAFQFIHHWSHAHAYRHTAQQTYELLDIDWGGGIYFNYVFTIAWLIDVASLWTHSHREATRPSPLRLAWYAFFLFMAINATIVFEDGPVRWISLVVLILLGMVTGMRYKGITHEKIGITDQ
jgi:uncharacterized membrane protein YoaK (UPF0700 family)